MAKAYAFAEAPEDHNPPPEYILLQQVDRFGAQAIYGRALGYGELRRMTTAETIIKSYNERKAASSWAEWAEANKGRAELLQIAMLAAQGVEHA